MMRLTAFNRESGYHSAVMTADQEVTNTQTVFGMLGSIITRARSCINTGVRGPLQFLRR